MTGTGWTAEAAEARLKAWEEDKRPLGVDQRFADDLRHALDALAEVTNWRETIMKAVQIEREDTLRRMQELQEDVVRLQRKRFAPGMNEEDHQASCAILTTRDGWDAECTCEPAAEPAKDDAARLRRLLAHCVELLTDVDDGECPKCAEARVEAKHD